MDVSQIIDAINKVLDFNKTAIISTIMMQEYTVDKVDEVRNACKIIADAGIYPFDSECAEAKLLLQIEDFIQKGLEETD